MRKVITNDTLKSKRCIDKSMTSTISFSNEREKAFKKKLFQWKFVRACKENVMKTFLNGTNGLEKNEMEIAA